MVQVRTQLDSVNVEITVLLGRSAMPMHQLLKLGRGAVIQLDAGPADEVWVLANNHPIARGELVIDGETVSVTISGPASVEDFFAAQL